MTEPEMDDDRAQYVRITRPCGASWHVSPLVGRKTLEALDRAAQAIREHFRDKDDAPAP